MKNKNDNLCQAKKAKKDEFYTRYEDIEKELTNYQSHFKDKYVYCNCDDSWSNFYKYFVDHYNEIGLKHLTATHIELDGSSSYRLDYDGVTETKTYLNGNGDFRSEECIELLKQSDVVVSNPPFSLFREYIAQLVEYNKKFLVIGNMNAITYKEIFPLIKEDKMWYGVSISSGDRAFIVPDDYELKASGCGIDKDGNKFIKVKGVRWFTNIDNIKRNTPLDLYKKYNSNDYPHYDNYDAINVDKTCEIPMDYDGVMGVPITFLDKYCPEQFEIVGITENADYLKSIYKEGFQKYDRGYINGKRLYSRILIRKK